MPLRNPFKLEKLKINIYGNRRRVGLPQDSVEVMFNPTSFSMRHENVYHKYQGINLSGRRARYAHSQSEQLALSLVFDGTGVTDYGVVRVFGRSQTVSERIEEFLKACFYMDGDLHEPKFLKIQWGEGALQDFDCRLQSVNINYTAFDKSGAPLRAELSTIFVEDLDAAKQARKVSKNSPDLPHSRTVKQGDTLPLMTKAIYGSSAYYLRVAQANGLDDFRNLTPGQDILFPPLES